LQIEIQDYHRDQLEKDGIFLPPREETVLTLSGNFTQKELDKAAKKGTTKKQSSRSEPIAAPTVEKSFDEMLQVLAIPKTEIKALSGAQNQTQFDYVKQRIFEQTGEIWEWEGAPKDGKWVRVDAIAASDDIDISKYCQPNGKEASAIAKKLGLQGEPKKIKEFAIMYPDYFTYNEKGRKLSYNPKPLTP
jgi:hypothetical protein